MKLLVAAALLVAGCSTQQLDADAAACAALAESYPVAPERRTTHASIDDRGADRQLAQAQRREACMRQKGYSLR